MKRLLGNISLVVMILLLFHSAAHAYKLPDTGQTECNDDAGDIIDCNGTGQDGAYNINPMSFTDNGDGTVRDNNTGLMWQKCVVGQEAYQATCIGIPTDFNGDQAFGINNAQFNSHGLNACGDSTTGNHTDWRLPTKKELLSIVDYGNSVPATDPIYFPNVPVTFQDQSYYWTSTYYAGYSNDVWEADMWHGGVAIYYLPTPQQYDTNGYVRCVRGGQTSLNFTNNRGQTSPSLANNDDGTVTDNRTGLIWQKCSSGLNNDSSCSGNISKYTWDQALAYCKSLSLGSSIYSQWRLPNIKEIESLSDDTVYHPAINSVAFPNVPSGYQSYYWSSTTDAGGPDQAWVVDFSSGIVDESFKVSFAGTGGASYVRCVRGGVNTCAVSAIAINGIAPYYSTIHDAYTQAPNGQSIQMQALNFPEGNLTLDKGTSIKLAGGYECGFTANPGYTTILGNITIGSGTLTIENLVLK
jgi:hypothetical protein